MTMTDKDLAAKIFAFLEQSEILRADTTCKAWRKIISAPLFWSPKMLDLSYAQTKHAYYPCLFEGFIHEFACNGNLISSVISQKRFSCCRALDLAKHRFQPCDWLSVRRSLEFKMTDLQDLNLRGTSIFDEEGGRCSVIAVERSLDFIAGLRNLTCTLEQRWFNNWVCESLASLTLDADYASAILDFQFPSLIHLCIENNRDLTACCEHLVVFFAKSQAVQTLTFFNCDIIVQHVPLLDSLFNSAHCPPYLERIHVQNQCGHCCILERHK